jgi:mRNA-degrading endonuclease toxin of MazEF toxin-antitoxin module
VQSSPVCETNVSLRQVASQPFQRSAFRRSRSRRLLCNLRQFVKQTCLFVRLLRNRSRGLPFKVLLSRSAFRRSRSDLRQVASQPFQRSAFRRSRSRRLLCNLRQFVKQTCLFVRLLRNRSRGLPFKVLLSRSALSRSYLDDQRAVTLKGLT